MARQDLVFNRDDILKLKKEADMRRVESWLQEVQGSYGQKSGIRRFIDNVTSITKHIPDGYTQGLSYGADFISDISDARKFSAKGAPTGGFYGKDIISETKAKVKKMNEIIRQKRINSAVQELGKYFTSDKTGEGAEAVGEWGKEAFQDSLDYLKRWGRKRSKYARDEYMGQEILGSEG